MYNMYLKQDSLVLKFPQLPDDIKFKLSMDNKKYNVLGIGEVVRIGTTGLKSFSISSYFPAKEADVYLNIVNTMIANKAPMRLIINKMNRNTLETDINLVVVISDFEQEEQGGEVGDIYYKIGFTEYRDFKARVV